MGVFLLGFILISFVRTMHEAEACSRGEASHPVVVLAIERARSEVAQEQPHRVAEHEPQLYVSRSPLFLARVVVVAVLLHIYCLNELV